MPLAALPAEPPAVSSLISARMSAPPAPRVDPCRNVSATQMSPFLSVRAPACPPPPPGEAAEALPAAAQASSWQGSHPAAAAAAGTGRARRAWRSSEICGREGGGLGRGKRSEHHTSVPYFSPHHMSEALPGQNRIKQRAFFTRCHPAAFVNAVTCGHPQSQPTTSHPAIAASAVLRGRARINTQPERAIAVCFRGRATQHQRGKSTTPARRSTTSRQDDEAAPLLSERRVLERKRYNRRRLRRWRRVVRELGQQRPGLAAAARSRHQRWTCVLARIRNG